MDIPILTVHDSIICQAKHKEFVRDKMLQYYVEHVNKAFKCNITYNPQHAHAHAVATIPDNKKTLPISYQLKSPVTAPQIRAINSYLRATKKPYEGKLPEIHNSVIEVDEDAVQVRCSKRCKHYERSTAIRAGKRIFLGKIKIQLKVVDKVASLEIVQ